METKVVSRDSFLDKLSENLPWMDSEKGNRVLPRGRAQCASLNPPPPPIGFGAPKRPGGDMVNMQIEVVTDLHAQVLIASTGSDPK